VLRYTAFASVCSAGEGMVWQLSMNAAIRSRLCLHCCVRHFDDHFLTVLPLRVHGLAGALHGSRPVGEQAGVVSAHDRCVLPRDRRNTSDSFSKLMSQDDPMQPASRGELWQAI
jgi:hypothetical protein